MEIELSPQSIARLADALAPRVALIITNKLDLQPRETDLVTTEEAARILGITPSRMRHIKDKFPHVKGGNCAQGKLLFKRDGLIKGYST